MTSVSPSILIGSYSVPVGHAKGTPGVGLQVCSIRPDTGALTLSGSFVAARPNPAYVAISPDGQTLAVAHELHDQDGFVALYNVQTRELMAEVCARGTATAHVAFDPTGKFLCAINYSMSAPGSFLILNAETLVEHDAHFFGAGSGVNADRQVHAHPHQAVFSADGRFLYVPDLGCDLVRIFCFDSTTGKCVAQPPLLLAPGCGPRHLVFHPSRPLCFVVNELASDVVVCRVNTENESLSPHQTVSTLGCEQSNDSTCAAIRISADGAFVYASNRGHDSIAVFSLQPDTNTLQMVSVISSHGRTPRDFILVDSLKLLFVANQDSDRVSAFKMQPDGTFLFTGEEFSAGSACCVASFF